MILSNSGEVFLTQSKKTGNKKIRIKNKELTPRTKKSGSKG